MDALMANVKQIGESFLNYFFQSTEVNFLNFTQNTVNSYQNDSVLTFESEVFHGKQNIAEKLTTLNVNFILFILQLVTKFTNYEIQPSNNGILIYLSGTLTIQGETNEICFSRVFFLASMENGSFYGIYI